MRARRLSPLHRRWVVVACALLPAIGGTWLVRPVIGVPSASLTLTLGSTSVNLQGTALEGLGVFDLGPAGMGVETASATARNPYREVTLTEVPYGATDVDDPAVGLAYPGAAVRARASLQAFRESQHATALGHPQAELFGTAVSGNANLVALDVDGPTPTPTVLVEWVTEAFGGVWLVRDSQAVMGQGGSAQVEAATAQAADIIVAAAAAPATQAAEFIPDTNGPIHLPNDFPTNHLADETPALPTVPTPSWWNGVCDTNNYSAAAQALTGQALPAYPLSAGAVWNGLVACGPRPAYNEGPDVVVHYPGAGWGVLEWECVELSMRWMYLAWHVDPYPANGSGVVWNYATFEPSYNPMGPPLQAIANNGSGPMPQPGDVLSYGATSSAGHTSLVTATNIDASGDGTVTVLEENASPTGWDTVSVSGWVLGGFDGGVSGWLHNPAA
jgi:hypothetical protein